ncbi:MAG: hypothetical protein AAB895_01020 [Patescibacteria group bacterium]
MENNNQKPVDPNTPPTGVKSKIVQTYAEDMVQVLEEDKSGLIKKIIQGEEAHEQEKRNTSPQSKKNKVFMILGVFMILVSGGILYYFISMQKVAPSVEVEKQFVPLIYTDKNSLIEIADIKKDEISKKFLNQVNQTTVKVGGVEAMYPTLNKAPVGFVKFIEAINGNFSIEDKKVVSENFLIGVHKNYTADVVKSDLFILLKVSAVPDVFAAMRSWENKMFLDLHGFFGTALSPETKYLLTKEFQNVIIENKNARMLYDKDNKIVLGYVFVDDNSIVITDSENTAREIMLRLGSSQIRK